MEIINSILSVILLIACMAPFILMGRLRSRNKIILIDKMKSLAEDWGGSVTQFEVCGGLAIGLDEFNKRLYLARNHKKQVDGESLCLEDYKKCEVIKITHDFQDRSEVTSVIDRVDFQFTGKSGSVKEVFLNLFNTERTIEMRGELQLANEWKKKINDLLR